MYYRFLFLLTKLCTTVTKMIPVTQIYTMNEKCISHQGTKIFAGKIVKSAIKKAKTKDPEYKTYLDLA